MKLFLAGPMTGLPEYNYPAFHAEAKRLRAQGHEVWNPAEQAETQDDFNPKTDEAKSHAHYMARNLPAVCNADAVVVLPGWRNSRGARLEVYVAGALGVGVFSVLSEGGI